MPKYEVIVTVETKSPELEPVIKQWVDRFIDFSFDGAYDVFPESPEKDELENIIGFVVSDAKRI